MVGSGDENEVMIFVEGEFSSFRMDTSKRNRCSRHCLFDGSKFFAKNVAAFSVGLSISIIMRIVMSAFKKQEPALLESDNGTELTYTDIIGCVTSLLLCNFLIKPAQTRMKEFCCSPKLLARSAVRNTIPLLIALSLIFLVKFIDVSANGPDHVIPGPNGHRIVEVSDFAGGILLLLSFHALDRLLEKRWSRNPYEDPDFSQSIPLTRNLSVNTYG